MRSSDVNGLSGKAAFDYALEANRRFSAGVPEERISGLGDNAIFLSGAALNGLIVQDGSRVVMLVGNPMSKDGATSLMKLVVAKL